jgi:hypothetical protein
MWGIREELSRPARKGCEVVKMVPLDESDVLCVLMTEAVVG